MASSASTVIPSESTTSQGGYVIPPPPEKTYGSEDEAIAALHAWSKDHGFNLSKRRAFTTEPKRGPVWKRGFECDRAGKPKNTQHLSVNERVRPMRGSKRMGCPMKIMVQAVSKPDPNGQWKIVHVRNNSAMHNHPPTQDPRVHVAHRQRAAQEQVISAPAIVQNQIDSQVAAGVPISTVRATILHDNPNSLVTAKDIANARQSARRRDMSTQTVSEALFAKLSEQKFFYRFDVDPETSELRHLFWAHAATAELYRQHPDVIIMDCTYKTNKYNIPLLNIITMTAFNNVLPVAQCWLPGEKEEDYVWFMIEKDINPPGVIVTDREIAYMNAVDRVFAGIPAIVCRWHMNKNVVARTRRVLGQVPVDSPAPGQPKYENSFQTNAFLALFYKAVESKTEMEFEKMRAQLNKTNAELAAYLDAQWWKYKTRIVHCWTNRYPHFEVRDSSAVEGTHAKCKRWLRNTRGDIYTVFNNLLPWWTSAAQDISLIAERSATIIPYCLQQARYASVVRVISVWALKETEKLWSMATSVVHNNLRRSVCTGVFRIVNGRPCIHDLMAIIESNGRLRLTQGDFAKHWWIRRYSPHNHCNRILEQ